MQSKAQLPSDVTGEPGIFDRFASRASLVASRAPFFAFCVALIVVWAPSVSLLKLDTWQLIINTATTIITFLMVALLQNSQSRNDQATQQKLNAVADGLATLMAHSAGRFADERLRHEVDELRAAVGIEDHESTASQ